MSETMYTEPCKTCGHDPGGVDSLNENFHSVELAGGGDMETSYWAGGGPIGSMIQLESCPECGTVRVGQGR